MQQMIVKSEKDLLDCFKKREVIIIKKENPIRINGPLTVPCNYTVTQTKEGMVFYPNEKSLYQAQN
jgi:hypothetical protein